MNLVLHHDNPNVFYTQMWVSERGVISSLTPSEVCVNVQGQKDPEFATRVNSFADPNARPDFQSQARLDDPDGELFQDHVMGSRAEWVDWYMEKVHGAVRTPNMESSRSHRVYHVNRRPPVQVERLSFNKPEPKRYI